MLDPEEKNIQSDRNSENLFPLLPAYACARILWADPCALERIEIKILRAG